MKEERNNGYLNMLRTCIASTVTATTWFVMLVYHVADFFNGTVSTDTATLAPFAIAIIVLSVLNVRRAYLRLKELLSDID